MMGKQFLVKRESKIAIEVRMSIKQKNSNFSPKKIILFYKGKKNIDFDGKTLEVKNALLKTDTLAVKKSKKIIIFKKKRRKNYRRKIGYKEKINYINLDLIKKHGD